MTTPHGSQMELEGPWWPDEMGTFNRAGWGFLVLLPDEYAVNRDELPEAVKVTADALERRIRDHLNGSQTQLASDGEGSVGEAKAIPTEPNLQAELTAAKARIGELEAEVGNAHDRIAALEITADKHAVVAVAEFQRAQSAEADAARYKEVVRTISVSFGLHHTSKWCRDFARQALQPHKETK